MPDPLHRRLGNGLRHASGVNLLAVIVAAPWMYGTTRHWAIINLCWLLSATVAVWGAGSCLGWRRPEVSPWLYYPVFFLLAAGWLGVLATPAAAPDAFTQEHFRVLVSRWPGSFVLKTPVETMWLFSGLLGVLLVAIDLSANRRWWVVIYTTLALVGVSIVVLGLLQVRTGARGILWRTDVPTMGYFFATYFHHSSAGAFINLVWPLAAARLLFSISKVTHGMWLYVGGAIVWGVLLLIALSGLGAQLSRFAQGNAVVLVIALIGWLIWRRRKPGRRRIMIGAAITLLVFATLIGAVSVRLGWSGEIRARWRLFLHEEKQQAAARSLDFRMRPDSFIPSGAAGGNPGPREAAVRTCLRMMPEAGFLGLGPGSWSANFARFTDDPVLRTFYLHLQFAHNDWLQTVVEWGILGTLAWGVLVVGGLREAFRSLQRSKTSAEEIGAREAMVAGVAAALTGVLLHSLVDFPLQIPSIQLYFIVLLALAWNAAPNRDGLAAEHER